MDLVEIWSVLSFEVGFSEKEVRLTLEHKDSGEVVNISPEKVRMMNMGAGVSFSAGWIAGAVAVLSGRVTALNLTSSFAVLGCANDAPIGEARRGLELAPGG